MNFGIVKIPGHRHCVALGCKKIASIAIGDTKNYYNLKNMFLCEEHAQELLSELLNLSGEIKPTVSENSKSEAKYQEVIKGYLKLLYDGNGITSKAKLLDLCSKHDIEASEDMSMKNIMELIFPEIN